VSTGLGEFRSSYGTVADNAYFASATTSARGPFAITCRGRAQLSVRGKALLWIDGSPMT
jgi:hypothetical protein